MRPRITTNKSPGCHSKTFYTVFRYRIWCIGWTAWVVLATLSKYWRNPFLIKLDSGGENFSHAFTDDLPTTFSINSLNSVSKLGCFRSTLITNWPPFGRMGMWDKAKWRSCLDTRWRTTDPPTDLFTISPIWGALEVFALTFRYTTSVREVARNPVFVVRAKSLLARNRFLAGSTGVSNYSAVRQRCVCDP